MPSTCVAERVAQALKAQLDKVVAAGHLAEVARPRRAGLPSSPGHRSAVLLADDPVKQAEGAHGYTTWRQQFVVVCYARPADAATTAIETTLNEMRARVEARLVEDITLGGVALDLTVEDPVTFDDEVAEAYAAVAVVCEALYRHLETDPYSQ